MVRVEFFYSPKCPHCRLAKNVVRRVEKRFKRMSKKGFGEKVEVEMVNTFMPRGRMKALKYGIRGVPTIMVNGKKKIVGVPREKGLRKLIEKEMER